jgi:hypothetical protein
MSGRSNIVTVELIEFFIVRMNGNNGMNELCRCVEICWQNIVVDVVLLSVCLCWDRDGLAWTGTCVDRKILIVIEMEQTKLFKV